MLVIWDIPPSSPEEECLFDHLAALTLPLPIVLPPEQQLSHDANEHGHRWN